MKNYNLIIDTYFNSKHKKAGLQTGFVHQMFDGNKIHQIVKDFDKWEERIEKVNNGKAVLHLKFWDSTPHAKNSKLNEFLVVTNKNDISIQEMAFFKEKGKLVPAVHTGFGNFKNIDIKVMAQNEGMSIDDFNNSYENTESYGIIHFTEFHY